MQKERGEKRRKGEEIRKEEYELST